MNRSWNTRTLVEAGLCLALSFVLGRIKLFSMPQGGSVTAGQMIPLIFFAIRHGAGKGIIVGIAYGLLDMAIGGYVIHPVQAILDYPAAFGFLGLAGLFSKKFFENNDVMPVIYGTVLGVFARFICHTLTGVIFFASYAPEGQNAWAYSAGYNGTFLAVELAITIVLIFLLRNVLTKDLKNM